ncbi:MAG: zinc-dependent alcohol dehydrogenase [Solirubrobacterales bacterium]
MKALCWEGKHQVAVNLVDDPKIVDPTDMIVKVKASGICGSDLHLYDGYIPTMEKGDILGHETFGEVVETGRDVKRWRIGDRVAVPFNISCGECRFCKEELYSLCDRSNPNASMAAKLYEYSPSGYYGYSHLFGGYAGGQAEFLRVPFADVIPVKIPEGVSDDDAVLLTDNFPTGYMAAENCSIRKGDTVVVFGAGSVGQFSARSALLLGAGRVIVVDRLDYRLQRAAADNVTLLNYERQKDVIEAIKSMTEGRGPDSCIDAVGLEAHANSLMGIYDSVKQTLSLETDRPTVLRWAIQLCRKGGTISVPGVYGGFIDKYPMGAFFNKGLTMRTGQTHVHKYLPRLLQLVLDGKIKPSDVVSHHIRLDEAPQYYQIFRDKRNECLKTIIRF